MKNKRLMWIAIILGIVLIGGIGVIVATHRSDEQVGKDDGLSVEEGLTEKEDDEIADNRTDVSGSWEDSEDNTNPNSNTTNSQPEDVPEKNDETQKNESDSKQDNIQQDNDTTNNDNQEDNSDEDILKDDKDWGRIY